jgi:carbonic anhydrase
MANVMTDRYLDNNKQYAGGQAVHKPVYPGKQPIQPSKHVAVLACMDARLDVEDLLGLQTGNAHIIRNAGGVVAMMRSAASSFRITCSTPTKSS